MSLYASVCNNTVAMWPLCIELIVSFWHKNNTGKISVTQGKHREFHFGLNVATLRTLEPGICSHTDVCVRPCETQLMYFDRK